MATMEGYSLISLEDKCVPDVGSQLLLTPLENICKDSDKKTTLPY